MGHVVNPINYRLGYNRYWNSTWGVSDLKNYAHLSNQDFLLKKLIFSFFNQWSVQSANFIVSDVKVLRKFNDLNLFIYIYDSTWEEFLGDFYYKFLESHKYSKILRRKFKNKIRYKFWENRWKYKRNLKIRSLMSSSTSQYKVYLNELFSFYVFFVRSHLQKPIYKYLKYVLTFHVNKLLQNKSKISLYFIGLTNNTITASFLAKFLTIKLERSFFLFEVLKIINKSLKSLVSRRILHGYRIKFSGRYSRKQMAVALINGFGSFARSSIETRLDYAFSTAKLRFSTCGIKVWLAFSSKSSFLQKLRQRRSLLSTPKSRNKQRLTMLNLRKLRSLPSSFLIF